MERGSSFERVVGAIPEEEKQEIIDNKAEIFREQKFPSLESKEREKTPEELQIIELVNTATNEVREKFGLDKFDVPPKNVHVIKDAEWPDGQGPGMHVPNKQAVLIRERMSSVSFMAITVHEMIHFKSYTSAQVTIGDKPELEQYRLGLVVFSRDGEMHTFERLNEAVTEELSIRVTKKLIANPVFKKDVAETKEVMNRYRNAKKESGEPLFHPDTLYASAKQTGGWKNAFGRIFGMDSSKKVRIVTEGFGYRMERQILGIIIHKIYERGEGKYQSKEDVFEVFAKAMVTGNILPLARMIDGTFGRGTFSQLSEVDNDKEALMKYVKSL